MLAFAFRMQVCSLLVLHFTARLSQISFLLALFFLSCEIEKCHPVQDHALINQWAVDSMAKMGVV